MQNPFLRFFLLAIFSFLSIALIRAGYYSCSDGFSLTRIENRIEPDPHSRQKAPTSFEIKTIQKICSTPFVYLKKGSQAYAFQSQSAPYILKLYKCHHLQPADWLYRVPFPQFLHEWRKKLINRRQYKLELAISSFSIAQKSLKNECGIFYSQVLPNSTYEAQATIIDGARRKYQLNLANYGYALQRKAQLVYPSLSKWIQSGDIQSAKKAISSLIGLMAARSKKGIQDSDPDLHKNAGLVGTTAIFIDIGSFHRNPKISDQSEMKRDIQKISTNLLSWLETKNNELYEYTQSLLETPWEASWSPIDDA